MKTLTGHVWSETKPHSLAAALRECHVRSWLEASEERPESLLPSQVQGVSALLQR